MRWQERQYLPQAYFSDCGTFVYLCGVRTAPLGLVIGLYQIVHHIEVTPKPPQFIKTRGSEYCTRKDLSWCNRFYDLRRCEGSIQLGLDKRTGKLSVQRHDYHHFTSFPAYLTHAKQILLLGPSQDSQIRILFLPSNYSSYTGPVEIKTIPLTFADLRSRLDASWEKHHGVPYELQWEKEEEEEESC